MDSKTRNLVRRRAEERCEYCHIQQRHFPDYRFHVEHIVAKQHGGQDDAGNLALACHLCNNKKGPNLSGIDPGTGRLTRLFHPRSDVWQEHFRADKNGQIIGLTAIGRTSVAVLGMNSEIRVQIRRAILSLEGSQDS